MKKKLFPRILASVLLMAAMMGSAFAEEEPTAFDLIKEGNRYVGEQAKDRVVQIRSDKSVGTLTPTIWYVVYYDPTATLKATEVKFGAGKMMDVKRPMRLLEPITGGHKPLDPKKLKVDSDKALKILNKEPLLQKVKMSGTQFWTDRLDEETVWKIKVWAEKQGGGRSVVVGEVYISTDTGDVLKSDLHIDRTAP